MQRGGNNGERNFAPVLITIIHSSYNELVQSYIIFLNKRNELLIIHVFHRNWASAFRHSCSHFISIFFVTFFGWYKNERLAVYAQLT